MTKQIDHLLSLIALRVIHALNIIGEPPAFHLP
jgi:hypothetical protein